MTQLITFSFSKLSQILRAAIEQFCQPNPLSLEEAPSSVSISFAAVDTDAGPLRALAVARIGDLPKQLLQQNRVEGHLIQSVENL